MSPDPSASSLSMVGRALRRRCPRCGWRAFSSYFGLREHCERCGLRFEREEGYWVGALIVNTAVVFGSFLLLFVGGIAVTWPDVPWGALAAVTLGAMLILPLVLYPLSKTMWMALELSWHPLEEKEIAEAERRRVGPPPEGGPPRRSVDEGGLPPLDRNSLRSWAIGPPASGSRAAWRSRRA